MPSCALILKFWLGVVAWIPAARYCSQTLQRSAAVLLNRFLDENRNRLNLTQMSLTQMIHKWKIIPSTRIGKF